MTPARFPRHRGFTLLELVVTVSVAAVLVSLGAPYMRQLLLAQYVRSAAIDLQTTLIFARSEAIKRAADVSVVPVSSAWTKGWSVQLADGTVLRAQKALSANLSATAGSTITYGSNGRVNSAPGQLVFATSITSVAARCVLVDLSGRPSVIQDTDGNPSNGCN